MPPYYQDARSGEDQSHESHNEDFEYPSLDALCEQAQDLIRGTDGPFVHFWNHGRCYGPHYLIDNFLRNKVHFSLLPLHIEKLLIKTFYLVGCATGIKVDPYQLELAFGVIFENADHEELEAMVDELRSSPKFRDIQVAQKLNFIALRDMRAASPIRELVSPFLAPEYTAPRHQGPPAQSRNLRGLGVLAQLYLHATKGNAAGEENADLIELLSKLEEDSRPSSEN